MAFCKVVARNHFPLDTPPRAGKPFGQPVAENSGIRMLFNLSREARWRKQFRRTYPFLSETAPEAGRLRLILGAGRSGTSWVCQVLFKSTERLRCFSEPLFHIEPRLPFHSKGDHTAAPFGPVNAEHPLALAYALAAHPQYAGPKVPCLERNDSGWTACLVKEVHALAATGGLLDLWKPPTVFIARDPVYIIDSLLSAQTLDTIYLDHEVKAVAAPEFLGRYAPKRREAVERWFAVAERLERRQRILLSKVVCVQLLQDMFHTLASELPHVHLARYEDLCAAPRAGFRALAAALSLPWDDAMEQYLAKTTESNESAADPYSVVRKTEEQRNRPMKFLSAGEERDCRAALDKLK